MPCGAIFGSRSSLGPFGDGTRMPLFAADCFDAQLKKYVDAVGYFSVSSAQRIFSALFGK